MESLASEVVPMANQARILIVDDEADVAVGLKALLTARGFIVELAHDGVAALKRLSEGPRPDLLMLDEFSIAVDPVTTMRIEDVLKQLKSEISIILVTNLVQQAERLADRTAFFLNGELVEVGQTEDMFSGRAKDVRTTDYVEGRFG